MRNKLDYLAQTKRLLRESINGVLADRAEPLLTESDPFEAYPSALYAGSPAPSAGSLDGSAADKLLRLNETKQRLREAINVELAARGEPLLTDAEVLRLYSSRLFFTPLELFANGEQGAWYDPSDLATLFQDAAGTTPVTADGDPVGLMLDKSGNGNHVSQSVAASRPIYRTNGTLHWLEADGVDDQLLADNITQTNLFIASVAFAKLEFGTANWGHIYQMGAGSNPQGGFGIRTPMPLAGNTSEDRVQFRIDENLWAPRSATQYQDSTPIVTTHGLTSDGGRYRINGVLEEQTATVFSRQFGGAAQINLFSRGDSANSKSRIYGFVLVFADSDTSQAQALDAYLASKVGVTLP